MPATSELRQRARRIGLVLTDCDGVLTDAGVYYSRRGESLRRFSVRDGMGVERLREAGIATAILSRENAPSIAARSAKLHLPYLFLGVPDKAAHLVRIVEQTRIPPHGLAYVGDDLNDLELLRLIGQQGLTGAPADAEPEVLDIVQFRGRRPGGHGAFREFADWILRLRTAD